MRCVDIIAEIRFRLDQHKERWQKKHLCSRGWHKLVPKIVQFATNRKMTKFTYLRIARCSICDTILFADPKDKRRWNYHQKRNERWLLEK